MMTSNARLPLDLRTQFGAHLRLGWEANGTTRSAWPEPDRAWLVEIQCKRGIVYAIGGNNLAAFTDRPRVGARLRRLPFILSARGDLEVVVTFASDHIEAVLAILKPYRRRRLSPAQREKNAATLARARQNRRQPLTQTDFPVQESTHGRRDDVPMPRSSRDRVAAGEVLLSQQRGAGHPRRPGRERKAPAQS